MNSENKVPESSPVAPAAVLLFQAPQFTAPVFEPPKNSEPKPESGTGKQSTSKQGSGKDSSAKGKRGSASSGSLKKSGKGGQASKGAAAPSERKSNDADEPTDSTRPAEDSNQGSAGSSKGKVSSRGKKQSRSLGADVSGPQALDSPESSESEENPSVEESSEGGSSTRRRRRRPRAGEGASGGDDSSSDGVQGVKGSTRLEAKRMRRREGRRESRRRQSITESEFLARREAVNREMVVRHLDGADQIAVLEDDILVEHFVARKTTQSIVGNIYLGRVQNVLPSMEAAFIDIGRGRNAVLYAGEVNWDSLGMEGQPRRIESALKSGDTVMVQVTKDPIGHKGARLTSQITLAGRYLVLVPGSSMLGISRKLPDPERNRLKRILREVVPDNAGVIVRTAAEGATEEQLRDDVERLTKQWVKIEKKAKTPKAAPVLLRGEPELVVRVVRDIFNEDFSKLIVQGNETWKTVSEYVEDLSPELSERLDHWTSKEDIFQVKKVQQQLSKAMDRKVWLPSGGTLVIERTEALTVIDVNTGKFVGSGGTLEETVTRNNLEAAEEIVRQLRLRDIGGIVIIDFVDMVLESNRELVLRRLVECLGRDRTRHQVTEITSLGLVQMTRKRVGEGLVEAFSTTCEACEGRGFIVHDHPVEANEGQRFRPTPTTGGSDREVSSTSPKAGRAQRHHQSPEPQVAETHVGEEKVRSALSAIAAASAHPEAEIPSATGTLEADLDKDHGAIVSVSADEKPMPERIEKTTPKKSARRAQMVPQSSPAEAKATEVEVTHVVTSLDEIELPEHRSPDEDATRPARRRSATTRSKVKEGGSAPVRRAATRGATVPPSSSNAEPLKGGAEVDAARDAVRELLSGERQA